MALALYNSLTRKKEAFKPIKKTEVSLYTCGPTVYDYAHIGNLRTYIFEDILKRTLIYNRFNVKHIMNITDVGHLTSDADTGEDKLEKGAKREGKSVWDIAKFYTKSFKEDIKKLNILSPKIWCKATDHIKEQIEWIRKLEMAGFTYSTSDGVYFDTSKFKDYGKIALLEKQKLQGGKRIDLGEKKNKTDFALWKFSPKDEKRQMEWKSPWGIGFPGWHIECSVMSIKYLGKQFDIHCGGIDHLPIHHTNEIAQTEAITNKKWVNYWLHGEFLLFNEGKMAKSGGSFITLESLEKKGYSPLVYRYFCLNTHYRKQLNFTEKGMDAAKEALEKIKEKILEIKKSKSNPNLSEENKLLKEFENSINDDLNTPKALASLWKVLKSDKLSSKQQLNLIKKIDSVLALDLTKIKEAKIPKKIIDLAEKRLIARKNKDWKLSDKLRNQINSEGYLIEDKENSYSLKNN